MVSGPEGCRQGARAAEDAPGVTTVEEPNRVGIRSAWQDVELVWRVLWALVARMDLGGMGPLVA